MISNAHESRSDQKCCDIVTHAEQSVKTYLDSFIGGSSSQCTKNNDGIDSSSRSSTLRDLDCESTQGGEMAASFDRVVCCNSSRSLYCEKCCSVLVPDYLLPSPISMRKRINGNGEKLSSGSSGRPLMLPFNLHIVLDDRKGSATGLHAVALLNQTDKKCARDEVEDYDHETFFANLGDTASNQSPHSFDVGSVRLIDLSNDDKITQYRESQIRDNPSTFVLFPAPGESVPLESVASEVQTLVVLDCKWTKRRILSNNELASLPKVHLSYPPRETYYWRWHNAGKGMVSTIEAIYYAAYEVSQMKHQLLLESNLTSEVDSEKYLIDQKNLLHLLWLFGHQRAATFKSARNEGKPAPCTDEGKELQRELRKQKGTWRQLRHKEDERRLKERNRLREEKKLATA